MDRSPELEKILAACASSDVTEQRMGLAALRGRGTAEHLPIALSLLNADDPGVRSATASASGALAAAVGYRLLPLLQDPDAMVRADAIDAIAAVHFQIASGAIERLLQDEDASVRASAAEALGSLESREARASLEGALEDEDDAVRGFAASSLGRLHEPDAIRVLDAMLDRELSPAVRAELYAAEYRLGRKDQLGPLLDTIAASDVRTTSVAMNALLDLLTCPICTDIYDKHEDVSRVVQAAVLREPIHAGLANRILACLAAKGVR
jgi:HEAT repeat protein